MVGEHLQKINAQEKEFAEAMYKVLFACFRVGSSETETESLESVMLTREAYGLSTRKFHNDAHPFHVLPKRLKEYISDVRRLNKSIKDIISDIENKIITKKDIIAIKIAAHHDLVYIGRTEGLSTTISKLLGISNRDIQLSREVHGSASCSAEDIDRQVNLVEEQNYDGFRITEIARLMFGYDMSDQLKSPAAGNENYVDGLNEYLSAIVALFIERKLKTPLAYSLAILQGIVGSIPFKGQSHFYDMAENMKKVLKLLQLKGLRSDDQIKSFVEQATEIAVLFANIDVGDFGKSKKNAKGEKVSDGLAVHYGIWEIIQEGGFPAQTLTLKQYLAGIKRTHGFYHFFLRHNVGNIFHHYDPNRTNQHMMEEYERFSAHAKNIVYMAHLELTSVVVAIEIINAMLPAKALHRQADEFVQHFSHSIMFQTQEIKNENPYDEQTIYNMGSDKVTEIYTSVNVMATKFLSAIGSEKMFQLYESRVNIRDRSDFLNEVKSVLGRNNFQILHDFVEQAADERLEPILSPMSTRWQDTVVSPPRRRAFSVPETPTPSPVLKKSCFPRPSSHGRLSTMMQEGNDDDKEVLVTSLS